MREYDREVRKIKRAFWIAFSVNALMAIAVLCGIGWVVYVLLKHFGIVG